MKRTLIMLILLATALTAQHRNHPGHDNHNKTAAMPGDSSAATAHNNHQETEPDGIYRHGSGTGWLPYNSEMTGYMIHGSKWNFMFHGNIFLRYNHQDINNQSSRGGSKTDAPNWFMGMAETRPWETARLRSSSMISLDLLFGGKGYPLLFQSGETYEGKPIVDRQHPHDLFSELSVELTQSLSSDFELSFYLGYPGEPALGPVAFMHRPSAQNNPDAPLGHHWQDATHITFGVATAGFRYRFLKLEGSVFTGKEPDETRYNFDKPLFDSWSVRLSANPVKQIAAQASYGFVESPEASHPGVDVSKYTASVMYDEKIGSSATLSNALVWGLNDTPGDHDEGSVLLESNLALSRLNIYGRYEWLAKSSHELGIQDQDHNAVYQINALTIGVNYPVATLAGTSLLLGTQASFYKPDSQLEKYYGKNPVSLQVYLRVAPLKMIH